MKSSGFTVRVGQQSAGWVRSESGEIGVLRVVDYNGGITMSQLEGITALRCDANCVVFPDGPSLAQVRHLLPEYHSLWCAVSEQARQLGEQ